MDPNKTTTPNSDPPALMREQRSRFGPMPDKPDELLDALQKIQNDKGPQTRAFSYQRDTINEEARTVEVAFSSDTPYLRWWGYETLGHDEDEIDLSRMGDDVGAPVLVGHNWGGMWTPKSDEQVGVVERVWIEDGIARALLRFGRSAQAIEIFNDIIDGIRRQVSVGYFVNELVLTKETDEGEPNEYRATRWTPYEISIVPVAADFDRVGVGKAIETPATPQATPTIPTEVKTMDNTDDNTGSEVTEADVKTAASDALAEERARTQELLDLGREYDEPELATKYIENGGSAAELTRAILQAKNSGQKLDIVEETADIGMNEREAKSFSFLRLMAAQANPDNKRLQEAAAFEFDACAAAAEKMRKEAQGHIIPYDVLTVRRSRSDFRSKADFERALSEFRMASSSQRDYAVGAAATGGNLVDEELLLGSFIERLENALTLRRCGISILAGLIGDIAVPRQNGGASSFWITENEDIDAESAATFDQVKMTPKTVGAYSELSRRSILQTAWSMEAFAQNELALRLALAIDLAGINGNGTDAPRGILQTAGIGAVVSGGSVTHDDVVDLETAIGDSNAVMGPLCYLTNWRVRGQMKKARVDAGSGEFLWNRNAVESPVNGYRCEVSNQVPRTLGAGTDSALICGYFPDLVMGMWGGLDLLVNPYSKDISGAVRITALQDVDLMIRHPESFSAAVDIAA